MWYLIKTFTIIGLLTFGGGSSVTPLLFDEFVTKKKYISNEEFLDYTLLSTMLPGPSMIQLSTAIGYKIKGTAGSIIAPIMISLPSILIFTITMIQLRNWINFKTIIVITAPLFLVIAYSMVTVVKKLGETTNKNWNSLIIVIITVILILIFKINPGILIITAIIIGLLRGKQYDC